MIWDTVTNHSVFVSIPNSNLVQCFQFDSKINDVFHLVQKPPINPGEMVQLIDAVSTAPQCTGHKPNPLVCWFTEILQVNNTDQNFNKTTNKNKKQNNKQKQQTKLSTFDLFQLILYQSYINVPLVLSSQTTPFMEVKGLWSG